MSVQSVFASLRRSPLLMSLVRWFDSEAGLDALQLQPKSKIDWFRIVPFLALHLACLAVIWVGWGWFAVAVALGLYLLRMFAITGFYHRYFSHKSFKTSRFFQFLFAVPATAPCSAAPSGGPPITGTTTAMPTGKRTSIRRHAEDFSTVTWAGSPPERTFQPR